jgi:hypothetical protein
MAIDWHQDRGLSTASTRQLLGVHKAVVVCPIPMTWLRLTNSLSMEQSIGVRIVGVTDGIGCFYLM